MLRITIDSSTSHLGLGSFVRPSDFHLFLPGFHAQIVSNSPPIVVVGFVEERASMAREPRERECKVFGEAGILVCFV